MESDTDSYFLESSFEAKVEVAGPLLEYLKVNLEESPESPPPGSPSPVLPPQPIPVGELSPVWELPDDGTIFLNCYTRVDVLELKQWAQETRSRRGEEEYFVEEPVVSQNFMAVLQQHHGPQWEFKFLRAAAKLLFEQMLSYILGYAKLTSHNERLLRRPFITCTAEVMGNSCGCWRSPTASSESSKPFDCWWSSGAF